MTPYLNYIPIQFADVSIDSDLSITLVGKFWHEHIINEKLALHFSLLLIYKYLKNTKQKQITDNYAVGTYPTYLFLDTLIFFKDLLDIKKLFFLTKRKTCLNTARYYYR